MEHVHAILHAIMPARQHACNEGLNQGSARASEHGSARVCQLGRGRVCQLGRGRVRDLDRGAGDVLDMTQAGNLIPSTLKEPIDCSLDFTKTTKQCVEQVRAECE